MDALPNKPSRQVMEISTTGHSATSAAVDGAGPSGSEGFMLRIITFSALFASGCIAESITVDDSYRADDYDLSADMETFASVSETPTTATTRSCEDSCSNCDPDDAVATNWLVEVVGLNPEAAVGPLNPDKPNCWYVTNPPNVPMVCPEEPAEDSNVTCTRACSGGPLPPTRTPICGTTGPGPGPAPGPVQVN